MARDFGVNLQIPAGIDLTADQLESDLRVTVREFGLEGEAFAKEAARDVSVERGGHTLGAYDTGALLDGIAATGVDIAGQGVVSIEVQATAPHSATVELGRRPGSRPPPRRALHAWLRRRGIPLDAAYPIAQAIGRRGLPPRPFMRPAFERLGREAPDILAGLASKLQAMWRSR